jgi:hypothetical protein
MNAKLETLIRLQQVDQEMARLQLALTALPKRLEAVEQELRKRKLALEQAEKAVAAEEAKRRRMESDLKDQQQKIIKYRDQSNSVKTNEQFHALQHEIGFVEQEIRRIEDVELASMIESENLDRVRGEARRGLAAHEAIIEEERHAIRVDSADRGQELDAHRKQRETLRAAADKDLLEEYDRLANSARKTPLARASVRRCMACQMALRPQHWNEIRDGALIHCESCGRMLYFDPSLEPEQQA